MSTADHAPSLTLQVGDRVTISGDRKAQITAVGRVGYLVCVLNGRDAGAEIFRHQFEVFSG